MAHILVVEDSTTQALVIKMILEGAGHEVVLAENGRIAFDHLHISDFDIVLSDVQMPILGGFDLCKMIRQQPQFANLPIILLTALNELQDMRKGLDVGANMYIVKPFSASDLLRRLSKFLPQPPAAAPAPQTAAAGTPSAVDVAATQPTPVQPDVAASPPPPGTAAASTAAPTPQPSTAAPTPQPAAAAPLPSQAAPGARPTAGSDGVRTQPPVTTPAQTQAPLTVTPPSLLLPTPSTSAVATVPQVQTPPAPMPATQVPPLTQPTVVSTPVFDVVALQSVLGNIRAACESALTQCSDANIVAFFQNIRNSTARALELCSPAPAAAAPAASKNGKTLLLIEPADSLRVTLKKSLEKLGYTVHAASSTNQGISASQTYGAAIGIMVSEAMMCSPELVRMIRQANPRTKLLCIVGGAEIEPPPLPPDVHTLPRPFTMSALLARLRELQKIG